MAKFDDLYYKGYVAGYRDGLRDAAKGKEVKAKDHEFVDLPIQAMELSVRACNCLALLGCRCIGDVAALDGRTIATARGIGVKTAREIAQWLDERGICYTQWSVYL